MTTKKKSPRLLRGTLRPKQVRSDFHTRPRASIAPGGDQKRLIGKRSRSKARIIQSGGRPLPHIPLAMARANRRAFPEVRLSQRASRKLLWEGSASPSASPEKLTPLADTAMKESGSQMGDAWCLGQSEITVTQGKRKHNRETQERIEA